MSFEKLKANKQFQTALFEAGIRQARPIQSQGIPKIMSGADVVLVGADGSGKSLLFVLTTIVRLNYAKEEAPRALIIAADRESVEHYVSEFELLCKYNDLRIIGVHNGQNIESQRNEIADGVDVIIGTPDRILALYLKSGININKLKYFILDDGDKIVRAGMQSLVHQLTESLPKCQHLVATDVYHGKLDRLLSFYIHNPEILEVDEFESQIIDTIPLHLYLVPNFKTKLNLINLLMTDEEVFDKVVIFVNTKLTTAKLYNSLFRRFGDTIAVLKPSFGDQNSVEHFEQFLQESTTRILLVCNEFHKNIPIDEPCFLIHFDAPEIELFISRVALSEYQHHKGINISFATDLELSTIKKIELKTGNKMLLQDLPIGLVIEGNTGSKEKEEEDKSAESGGAFHEKKASNAKNYNLGMKDKLKLKAKNEKYRKRK